MTKISRADLRKLALMCEARMNECAVVAGDPSTPETEKELANMEWDRMTALCYKLRDIANGNAKRVEITI